MVQPALWIRGIAEGLRKDGVLIHENSPVTNLSGQVIGPRRPPMAKSQRHTSSLR